MRYRQILKTLYVVLILIKNRIETLYIVASGAVGFVNNILWIDLKCYVTD